VTPVLVTHYCCRVLFCKRYVRMLEALLATIIRPCLGQGSNKSTPMPKDDANELFGTLRAEEILAINTAFREQLRVRDSDCSAPTLRAGNGTNRNLPCSGLSPRKPFYHTALAIAIACTAARLTAEYRCSVMFFLL